MHLINIHRKGVKVRPGPALHPRLILPGVPVQLIKPRGGAGTRLHMNPIWISFQHLLTILPGNSILIQVKPLNTGYKALPHPPFLQAGHGIGMEIPSVKIAHH